MKYIFLLSLLVTSLVSAESIGLHVNSLRGLSRKQCNVLLKAYDGVSNPKISFLWGTFDRQFSDGFDCAKEFLNRFKDVQHTIQIYADNSTCHRAPRFCEKGEIGHWLRAGAYGDQLAKRNRALLSGIGRRGAGISEFIKQNTSTNTEISIVYSLEDDFTNSQFRIFKNKLDRQLPTTIRGRNPNGYYAKKYNTFGSDFIELHPLYSEFDNRTFAFSNDGVDADFGHGYRALNDNLSVSAMFGDLRYFQESGNTRFVWFWWNNQGITDKFTKPSKRTFIIRLRDILLINKELLQ